MKKQQFNVGNKVTAWLDHAIVTGTIVAVDVRAMQYEYHVDVDNDGDYTLFGEYELSDYPYDRRALISFIDEMVIM